MSIADRSSLDLVIVTGLSGAGKSTALRVLEDAGYLAVDNLPTPIVETFLALVSASGEAHRVAMAADSRDRKFPASVGRIVEDARARGHVVRVLFLEASDDALVRRYSETRRRHPLAVEGRLVGEAIALERQLMAPAREAASHVLDTTLLTIHELKARVRDFLAVPDERRMHLVFMSFGFKYGIPAEASYVFDVRFLPNPYFVPELRQKTGRDPEILDWLDRFDETRELVRHLSALLDVVVPANDAEGKPQLMVCIGCTGGRHRSVAITEIAARRFKGRGYQVSELHRDIERA
ncbi:MAG: RNase adapter RapZ [Deltaproteobacteria bacterium]|nr:RNase adapter RapZ [Deltaproteobacteria bacterium]